MFEKRAKKRLTFTILLGLVCVMLFIACTCIISDTAPQTASAATTLTADEQAASICKHGTAVGGDGVHTGANPLRLNSAVQGGGKYVLNADTVLEETLVVKPDSIITLCLNGHKLTNSKSGPLIEISTGGVVVVYDCQGGGRMIGNSGAVVTVSGTHATSGRNSSFTMNGGVICDSSGIGVEVKQDGIFTMNGGVIKNNRYGVYCSNTGGTANINGGIITDNTNTSGNGAGFFCGNAGKINITGGTIRNNKTLAGNGAGIKCNSGTSLIITGGIIENNTAAASGGGIWCDIGVATITDSTIIRNNTASVEAGGYGGGWSVNLGGGVVIQNNKLSNGSVSNLSHKNITITSPITEGFSVGITSEAGVISTGYKSVGQIDPNEHLYFTSDDPGMTVAASLAGDEIALLDNNEWTIGLTMSDFEYGAEAVPTAVAKYGAGAVEYSYSDSESGTFVAEQPKNKGSYYVNATVPRTDTYTGIEASVPFEITARALTEAMVGNVEGAFTYTGAQHTPTVTVADGSLLTTDDYEISYGANIDAGTGTLTVTSKGNYSGEITRNFTIDSATMTASVRGYSGTYDKTAHDTVAAQTAITVNNQTATWTYSETSDGTYTVTMSQYINAGTYTVYYKVNAPNHNEYSGSFTVEIAKATVVAPAIAEKTYNGEPHTANVDETEEYAVTSNDGGTSAGEYDVILTLKDYANYKWLQGVEISGENAETATLKFTIAQAANDWTEAPQAGSVIYGVDVTATAQSAFGNVQITYVDEAGEILELDPKLAGKYKAVFTVEGTADYMGLREEVSFTIGQREITITIHDKTSVYGEETVPLTFELTEGEYAEGSDSDSIELRKEAGGDAKTYAITGECTNANYKVKFVNGKYKITKATYVTDGWKFDDKTVTYNGEKHSLAVTGLPAGLTVTYLSNDKTNVGTYEVTAKFNVDGNHNAVEDMTATLTIEKATYVTDNWTFDGKTVTYNGGTHSLEVTGLPAGLTVTYVNNDKTNVGTYVVTAKFEVDGNHNAVEDMTATLTIEKATYITNDWTFDGKTVTYNGGTHSLAVTGLPAGVQVSYINNGKTNAGTYEVTAKFSVDENHNAVEDMTATLTISKADHDMSGVTFEGKTVTYNGETHSLAVTGLPEGVEVTYVNNNKTNAGTYTVTAKFVASANYNELADMTATLTVEKAVYDMSGVKLEDKTIVADGNAQSITIGGTLPDGVTVTYEGNGQTDAGEYTVTAKFSGDAANYEPILDKTAKLTITQAPEKGGCGGVVLDGGTIAGITLAVLAFAVVFAVRKFGSKK